MLPMVWILSSNVMPSAVVRNLISDQAASPSRPKTNWLPGACQLYPTVPPAKPPLISFVVPATPKVGYEAGCKRQSVSIAPTSASATVTPLTMASP